MTKMPMPKPKVVMPKPKGMPEPMAVTAMPEPRPDVMDGKACFGGRSDTHEIQLPAQWSPPKEQTRPRRRYLPGARPFGNITTYRQSNGPFFLFRFPYGSLWISGIADSEEDAIDRAEQFYMSETEEGRKCSEEVPG